jgi:hypothetical protein
MLSYFGIIMSRGIKQQDFFFFFSKNTKKKKNDFTFFMGLLIIKLEVQTRRNAHGKH